MRTLTLNEVDAVSGGVVHVAWGIRVGGGAALGAAGAIAAELHGDGLQWSDWTKVGAGAALGAAGGFVSGWAKIKEALKMTDNAK